MQRILIDTDVFVDHIRGKQEMQIEQDYVAYSVVTRCELFAGKHVNEADVQVLLAPFQELPVDREIAELAGRFRRVTQIRTPDALIAATALKNKLALLTRNLRDFDQVPELEVAS